MRRISTINNRYCNGYLIDRDANIYYAHEGSIVKLEIEHGCYVPMYAHGGTRMLVDPRDIYAEALEQMDKESVRRAMKIELDEDGHAYAYLDVDSLLDMVFHDENLWLEVGKPSHAPLTVDVSFNSSALRRELDRSLEFKFNPCKQAFENSFNK